MSLNQLLNRKAAALFLKERGIPTEPSTLAKYATIGGGPAMRKFGRRVLYEPAALATWVAQKLTAPLHSTSDAKESNKQGDR